MGKRKGESKSAAKRDAGHIEKRLSQLNLALSQVNRKFELLFHNDSELGKNADNHDVQFCTMMRIFIGTMNQVIDRVNATHPDHPEIPKLTYAAVNAEFVEFTKFRSRPHFAKFMAEWFMGEDVSALGFEEETDDAPGAEDENPGGAVEFGGDYGESQGRDGVGDPDEAAAPDAVPEVPPADESVGGSGDGSQGVEVP